ncbi:MAG: glycoside-pentoside-hexuronide (GPH):cation symporter, partial [Candidatus Izemoplasmatales bacterium]|nr:glycoside-pentoside-hexuronide (GPH):cation symporter [Candidatus Izemoplasmatales bacterium]
MNTDVLSMEKKLLRRNKWAYSVGGIGRDMIYQLVATFFLTYIQFSGLGLTKEQFGVIGILLIIGRVWDAVNDPIMGSIVENTRSKFGKFKPWILLGAILTAIVIVFMFNFRPSGWGFVVFFGVVYLLWEMAFTLNDIPYWSLLPNLSGDKKERDSITTLVVVFAGVGAFLANAIVSFTTVGNAVRGYSMISITFAIFFIACTLLTVLGVKEPKIEVLKEEKVSIPAMFQVIRKNDQLLWAALSLMFYSIGSGLLVALGYNFFYMELGYDGTMVLVFVATFGVSNILVQSFYSTLAKRFSRTKLMFYSYITLAFGYIMLLAIGYLPFLPISLLTVCFFGAFVFSGQAIFYMILIVNVTNTIEYNEFKTKSRNEAVVFSLRPFIAKLSSALQQGVVTLVLIVSGVYMLSQNVSTLEAQKNVFDTLTISEQATYKSNIAARQVILDDVDLELAEIEAIYDALQLVTFEDADNNTIEEMIINSAANSAFR